jgi:uncharacterized protein with HEPN domain
VIRDPRLYLAEMVTSTEKIHDYTRGLSLDDFTENTMVQDAVLRRLEVIGEAAKHVEDDFRDKHPEIPWRQLAGLRDVLIHQYFRVNLESTWRFVSRDLSSLRRKVSSIYKSLAE